MDRMKRADPACHATSALGAVGLASGTIVLTLDGALPIEHLYEGDRIVTRSGAKRLARIRRTDVAAGTPIVRVSRDALGARPDRDIWLFPQQAVLLRDWRARALWQVDQACVPIERLIDGDYIRPDTMAASAACFGLEFDTPEILYADGLELASVVRPVHAST